MIVRQFLIISLIMVVYEGICQDNKPTTDSNALAHCIIENAKKSMCNPYVANTLDQNAQEKLVYFTDKFDCVTFVEYILATSINELKGTPSFTQILQQIRYRKGRIDGYSSRLHYFSEWISQNIENGHLRDVTKDLGGIMYQKDINYMSKHRIKYPKITSDAEMAIIIDAESRINKHHLYYIPKSTIGQISNQIHEGDIIGITTTINGLDFSHTGFACIVNNKIHLLHASETQGKIVISKFPLYEYLLSNKNQSGIVVLRPN